MARFCSLRDVANVYSLDTETLVQEMQQAAVDKTFQNIKEEESNWDKSHPIR
jgi:hypothetical protein